MLFYFFYFWVVSQIWPSQRYYKKKYEKVILFTKISSFICFLLFVGGPIIIGYTFWSRSRWRLTEIIVPYINFLISIGVLFLSVKIDLLGKALFQKIKNWKVSKKDNVSKIRKFDQKRQIIKLSYIFIFFITAYSLNLQYRMIPSSLRLYYNSNYDHFLFNFREIEDNYYFEEGEIRTIHYSPDYRLNILMEGYFSKNHLLVKMNSIESFQIFSIYFNLK